MKKYGLIGFPLGHSFSAKYFTERFEREGITDCLYSNHALENIEQLAKMLDENPDLKGFNVTIPYKNDVMAFLDDISEEAEQIGAVNCVKINDRGELKGYNTDVYGFKESLLELIGKARPSALVLGTGGASKAVKYALKTLGIKYISVSRTATSQSIDYDAVSPELVEQYPLIINTTPLGMYPKVESKPKLPYDALSDKNYLFDLVYNPALTAFLSHGKAKGSKVYNGHKMLILQAEKSWEIWNE